MAHKETSYKLTPKQFHVDKEGRLIIDDAEVARNLKFARERTGVPEEEAIHIGIDIK